MFDSRYFVDRQRERLPDRSLPDEHAPASPYIGCYLRICCGF
jgi:hypothetical protein